MHTNGNMFIETWACIAKLPKLKIGKSVLCQPHFSDEKSKQPIDSEGSIAANKNHYEIFVAKTI